MHRLVILTATVLLVTGCTSGSEDTPGGGADGGDRKATSSAPSGTKTSAAPTGPDCADVWKAGETLPAAYDQCLVDGAVGVQEDIPCADGSKLVTYDDTFYAVTGQEIVRPDISPMQDTEEFGAAFSACTGEE